MSHLVINAYPVPVQETVEEPIDVGYGMERAFDGTLLQECRARKRKWTFRSKPLAEQAALGLIALVQGRGHDFPLSDAYSAGGLYPSTSVATFRATAAADGSTTYDENGSTEAYVGTSAAVETGTTNVLSAIATNGANICTGTDALASTGGFTMVAGTSIASSTTAYWQGARSLIFNSSASGDAVRTSNATVAANATVTVSCYCRVTNVANVPKLRVYQGAGFATLATSGTGTTFSTTSEWRRLTLTATLTGGNTLVAMGVVASSATGDIYCDGWQIEELAYATSWTATTRATGSLLYTADAFVGWGSTTLNMWVTGPTTSPAARTIISECGGTSSNYIGLDRPAATNSVRFYTSAQSVTYSTNPWDGAWHMLTGVARLNPETGENALTLYWNGVSVGTPAATDTGWTGGTTSSVLSWGCGNGGTLPFTSGRIDRARVVPYALTAAEALAWFQNGAGDDGSLPILTCTGDFAETTVTVLGRVTNIENAPHFATAWRGNGRVVTFELEEV